MLGFLPDDLGRDVASIDAARQHVIDPPHRIEAGVGVTGAERVGPLPAVNEVAGLVPDR